MLTLRRAKALKVVKVSAIGIPTKVILLRPSWLGSPFTCFQDPTAWLIITDQSERANDLDNFVNKTIRPITALEKMSTIELTNHGARMI